MLNSEANLNGKIIGHPKWNNVIISPEQGSSLCFSNYLSSQVSRKRILDYSTKVTVEAS